MTIPVGKPELHPCPTCGKEVHRQMMSQHGNFFYYWFSHDAPCKRPCFKGGVSGRLYTSGAYHTTGCRECADITLAKFREQADRAMMTPNLKADK